MNRIASIRLSAAESRYWLELDDGRQLSLSPAVYLTSGYCLGDLVSQDEWDKLMRAEEKAQLRQRALTILDYGDRSETELRRRLQGEAGMVDELLAELRAARLLDDQAYAERAVERHLRRGGWGKRKLAYQLQRSGIAHDLIDMATGMISEEAEIAAALAWARRQLRDQQANDPMVVRRLYNGLLRRGFSHATVRSIVHDLERSP